MNRIWNYNGREYRFDISEKACVERLSDALRTLREDVGAADSTAAAIEKHCGMIAAFFDTVFGEGCGREICGAAESAEAYSEAYVDFIMFVNSEVNSFASLREEIETAYNGQLRKESEAVFG